MHLDVIPQLLLVTGVIFLILLVVLNKTLYRPLLNFMENRDKSIKRDLENTGKNSSDILAYQEEANKIILDAKMEASKIKEGVIGTVKEEASKKIEESKASIEKEYEKFLDELRAQKTELKSALIANMPAFDEGIKSKLSQI
ncbi:F0F1 ATP synthase subunit B family protein [Sulfurospirillum sp. 1612]|uniref:F0F1 ATP synthase subunit B family protein n=1 Tax=Sulfurospirillum sp. 1612 TaxID=3094835 RepID=UPI002F92737B